MKNLFKKMGKLFLTLLVLLNSTFQITAVFAEENDPRLKHAFDLFLNGLSDKEVEEQTGINRRTFRRYRARYNVTVDQRKNNEQRDS